MFVKQLKLENFVCYIGKKEPIVFNFSKGVNIVKGLNGGGKSHLFNAFYWTLYNRLYITDKGWEDGYPIKFIPDCLRKNAKEGDVIPIKVTLIIESLFHLNPDVSVEYDFTRSIEFKKTQKGFIISKDSELELSYLDDAGQTIYIPALETRHVIDELLPSRLRNYMWFQGETIDDLINFNDPNTLKQAVQTLSYYPVYLQIHRICELAHDSISEKISSNIRANKKLSANEERILRDIEHTREAIQKNHDEQNKIEKNIELTKEKVFEYSQKLNGYDKFPQIEAKISKIEAEDARLKQLAENIEANSKSSIIELWMLKGTHDLIEESSKVLAKFTKEIEDKSPTKNPIPIKIPGKVYIQKMLDDEWCYICERPAPKLSDEYKAIKRRISENENNDKAYNEAFNNYKYLESSYIEVANKPSELLDQINQIPKEIAKYRRSMSEVMQSRRENSLKKKTIFEELNINEEDINSIKQSSTTAKQLTEKLIFYKDEQTRFSNRLLLFKENERALLDNLERLNAERKKIQSSSGAKSEYELAEPYAELLINATKRLKEKAYDRLVEEIEKESNKLYYEYLRANTTSKGKIVIDKESSSVGIEDEGRAIILSKGLTTAAKMSVINSILSLSSKKIGRSYPLIADAPSSVFDAENTQMYTKKIGETFEQVIIMSKDYTEKELEKLSKEDHISNIWILESKEIDPKSKDKSRANYKTYISKIK